MKEKFKQIESRKELFAEIAVATGRKANTIENHWFLKWNIPKKFESVIEKIINKRLEYQKASKQLHEKYFGN